MCSSTCLDGAGAGSLEMQWELLFLCVGSIRAFLLSRDATRQTPPLPYPLPRLKSLSASPKTQAQPTRPPDIFTRPGVHGARRWQSQVYPWPIQSVLAGPVAVIPVGTWCGPRRPRRRNPSFRRLKSSNRESDAPHIAGAGHHVSIWGLTGTQLIH